MRSASPCNQIREGVGGRGGKNKGMNSSINERGDPKEQSVAFRGFQRLMLAKKKKKEVFRSGDGFRELRIAGSPRQNPSAPPLSSRKTVPIGDDR